MERGRQRRNASPLHVAEVGTTCFTVYDGRPVVVVVAVASAMRRGLQARGHHPRSPHGQRQHVLHGLQDQTGNALRGRVHSRQRLHAPSFVLQLHPGTKVYATGKFNGWTSLAPMWHQVTDMGRDLLRISARHPEGVNLIGKQGVVSTKLTYSVSDCHLGFRKSYLPTHLPVKFYYIKTHLPIFCAFDCGILLEKIKCCGITGMSFSCFQLYLANRKLRVVRIHRQVKGWEFLGIRCRVLRRS